MKWLLLLILLPATLTAQDSIRVRPGRTILVISDTLATPVPVPVPVPVPSPAGIVFASDWSTALGSSTLARRDGTKWDTEAVGNPAEMVVVSSPSPPGGGNSLRLQQQGSGSTGWGFVTKLAVVPLSTDYYVRYYFRNDDVLGTTQDHVVEVGIQGVGAEYNELTFLNKAEYATGWRPRLVIGCGPTACPWPNATMVNWDLGESPGVLAYGKWYRFEYWVHFTAPTRVQVHPRIYDDAGVLRFTDADFGEDAGWGTWPGATLASYYAGTNPTGGPRDFGITPSNLVNIKFGNNGSGSSTNTGLYWYFAKVVIRTDTWPGP